MGALISLVIAAVVSLFSSSQSAPPARGPVTAAQHATAPSVRSDAARAVDAMSGDTPQRRPRPTFDSDPHRHYNWQPGPGTHSDEPIKLPPNRR